MDICHDRATLFPSTTGHQRATEGNAASARVAVQDETCLDRVWPQPVVDPGDIDERTSGYARLRTPYTCFFSPHLRGTRAGRERRRRRNASFISRNAPTVVHRRGPRHTNATATFELRLRGELAGQEQG